MKELKRAMEVTSKNHGQEMKAALLKCRHTTKKLSDAQETVQKLRWQLRVS